jgi:formate dehydrogenase
MSITGKLIRGLLGFGSAPLGNMFRNSPAEEAAATVDATWQQGIHYFDTAPLYGAGLSEILALVRNYIPSYQWAIRGGWNIADCVERAYDLEGLSVGVVAAGRIGLSVLRRLNPFDVRLHYTQRHRLPAALEQELGLTFHADVGSLARACDVISLHCLLHPGTRHMINDMVLKGMKRGSYIVNTARAELCDRDAIVRAQEGRQLAGYAGDVWFPQPPPKDHPWRTISHHAMTPHVSGTTVSPRARYAPGTCEILECWFDGRPIRDEYLIVEGGKLAGTGARSYPVGGARNAAAAPRK